MFYLFVKSVHCSSVAYFPFLFSFPQPKTQLTGSPLSTDASGRTLFRTARVGDLEVALGQVVEFTREDSEDGETAPKPLGMVVALFKDEDNDMIVQVSTQCHVAGHSGGWAATCCFVFVSHVQPTMPS